MLKSLNDFPNRLPTLLPQQSVQCLLIPSRSLNPSIWITSICLIILLLTLTYGFRIQAAPVTIISEPVQSSDVTVHLMPDTNTVFRNPFMGWVLYPCENGDLPNASTYWASQNVNARYASTCYIRVLWSEMEPHEGVYAWNTDANFIALYQGALNRRLKLAFRVYVNSEDVPQQATPQWAFKDGVPIVHQGNDGPDPDITSPIFQRKYTTFIKALGAAFNDPSRVNWVDASTFGNWGEMNVNSQSLNASQRQQTMAWLCATYANAFTRVPTAMNFPGDTWSDAEYDSWCFDKGCTAMRRDGLAGPYGWVNTKQEKSILARWPQIPFIAENGFQHPNAAQQQAAVAQALYLHANFLDLRQPRAASNWIQKKPEWVKIFNLYGGYRFVVRFVIYPSVITANSRIMLQAGMQNWGVGVLPNNLKPWNNKYKFAFGLLDAAGNPVKIIVDTAPEDDPSHWTSSTPYTPVVDPTRKLPVGLMTEDYWLRPNRTYMLNVTGNLAGVPEGKYNLGIAVVDTSNANKIDISLAVNAPLTAAGWRVVGSISVGPGSTIR